MLSKVKSLLLDDASAEPLPELSEAEVERRIGEVKRKTSKLREQIESLGSRYRSTVDEAERVHGHELEAVRRDLAVTLNVDDVVTAVRSDDPVPTLFAVFDAADDKFEVSGAVPDESHGR
jgi:hypothetical protein